VIGRSLGVERAKPRCETIGWARKAAGGGGGGGVRSVKGGGITSNAVTWAEVRHGGSTKDRKMGSKNNKTLERRSDCDEKRNKKEKHARCIGLVGKQGGSLKLTLTLLSKSAAEALSFSVEW